MLPPVLIAFDFPSQRIDTLEAATGKLVVAVDHAARQALSPALAGEIRAVVTNGTHGLSAADMALLPNLEMIAVIGAGCEQVDLAAARARGIVVTNGAGANASSVADHAWALLMGVARALPAMDAGVRRGEWQTLRQLRPTVAGRRLGIFGLGAIGLEVAQRAAGGFRMSVAYHNRRPRADCPYHYCASLTDLAARSDFLLVAAPGGAETRHVVNAAVLDALGPDGFLINVGRGSVIDTQALIDALATHRIAGAALDVFEDEPDFPPALRQHDNIVMTPHTAGLSPEADAATMRLLLDNLHAYFDGRPVLTPVA